MKIRLLFLLLAFSTISLFGQNKPSHIIYNAKGKNVSYGKMLKSLSDKDIILFGELHNNPIAHWLQLELTRDLDESKDLILGAEMFETDNQYELNCYLKGESEYKELDTIARLWPNYKTDYAPLVNYAKENEIKFVATNIPRRYARMVFEGGLDTLNTLPEKAPADTLVQVLMPAPDCGKDQPDQSRFLAGRSADIDGGSAQRSDVVTWRFCRSRLPLSASQPRGCPATIEIALTGIEIHYLGKVVCSCCLTAHGLGQNVVGTSVIPHRSPVAYDNFHKLDRVH